MDFSKAGFFISAFSVILYYAIPLSNSAVAEINAVFV